MLRLTALAGCGLETFERSFEVPDLGSDPFQLRIELQSAAKTLQRCVRIVRLEKAMAHANGRAKVIWI